MAIRDAIVLNTTGSSFEALQSGDTVRVKGDLLVQDSSGTSLLSVGTSDTTVTLGGSVTSSAIISGSSTSTASFGRFVATTYTGDAREIASTLPRSAGIISGAAQIRDDVSGSFVSGFSFGATADQLYVGVSGSNSEHSASVSGSTRAMAARGSDLTHLKSDEIGHIRGIVGAGTFTAGDALGTGRGYVLGAGSQNAALAFGGYGPSMTNPRTGEIIGADIMLEFVHFTNRVFYDKLVGDASSNMSLEDEEDYSPAYKSSAPKKMDTVPFSKEDDDEDAMSYFQKLANE